MSADNETESVPSEGHDEAVSVGNGDSHPVAPSPAENEPTPDVDGVAADEDGVQPVPPSPPSKLRRIRRFLGRNADIFDVFGS